MYKPYKRRIKKIVTYGDIVDGKSGEILPDKIESIYIPNKNKALTRSELENFSNTTYSENTGHYSKLMQQLINDDEFIVTIENFEVEPESLTLYIGNEGQFTAKYYIYKNSKKFSEIDVTTYCEWETSDKNILTIDNKGKVTAINEGKCYISAKYNDKIVDRSVIVEKVPVKYTYSLTTDNDVVYVYYNESSDRIKYYIETKGDDDSYKKEEILNISNITFTSSNPNVAVVNNGYITTKAVGSTVITATYTYNGYITTKAITINVLNKLTGLRSSKTSVSSYEGETTKVNIYAQYSDGAEKNVTSDTKADTIYCCSYNRGIINHTNPGNGDLTISYTEGDITKTTTVHVTTMEKEETIVSIELIVSPDSISFTEGDDAVRISDYFSAKMQILYSDGGKLTTDISISDINFISKNTDVAEISYGKIFPVNAGTTEIYAEYTYDGNKLLDTISTTVIAKTVISGSISINPGEYYFPAEGERNIVVTVEASGDWEVLVGGDEFTFLTVTKFDDNTVMITAPPNITGKARSEYITFRLIDDPITQVLFKGYQNDYIKNTYISIDPTEHYFTVDGGSIEVTVDADGEWEVLSSGFLNAEKTGDNTATITALPNDSDAERSGNIVFMLTDNTKITALFTGRQGGYIKSLDSITTRYSSISGEEGEKSTIEVYAHYSDGTARDVTNDTTADTIYCCSYDRGTITHTNPGNGDLIISYTEDNITKTTTLNVTTTKKVEITNKLELSGDSSVYVGESINLTAMFKTLEDNIETNEENVTGEVEWSSEEEAIATVSSNGEVTGVSEGTTSITATYGDYTAMINIEVIKKEQRLDISGDSSLYDGETINLTATLKTLENGEVIYEEDVTGEVEWSSDDVIIARVSSNGEVTGVSEGTTSIIATYGDYIAMINIKVIENILVGDITTDIKSLAMIQSTTVTVLSNSPWTVETFGPLSWITFIPSSGNSGDELTISIEENKTNLKRTGIFYIKAGNSTKQIAINQAGSKQIYIELEYIEASEENVTLTEGESKQIEINAKYTNSDLSMFVTDQAIASGYNTNVCSYDNGKITYVGDGETDIKITYTDLSGDTASTYIHVTCNGGIHTYNMIALVRPVGIGEKHTISVNLNKVNNSELDIGDNELTPTPVEVITDDCTYEWEENNGIVDISDNGKTYTGMLPGETSVTIKYKDRDRGINISENYPITVTSIINN